MQKRVGKLEQDHVALKSSIDTLSGQQANQHHENRVDIARIKVLLEGEGDSEPGIKMKLDRVMILVDTRFDDVKALIKGLAWAIGICLAIIGLWFASLEYRHKLNTANAPLTSTTSPQDSDAGRLSW